MNSMQQDASGTAHYELFQHEADVGVRGFGANLQQAFEQAALALTAVVSTPASIEAARSVEMECTAPNAEFLLVDWLNELVYAMATRKMLFSRFEVRIDNRGGNLHLVASAGGEPIDVLRHRPATEVKGATLSELRVGQLPDGRWQAQCIVDV